MSSVVDSWHTPRARDNISEKPPALFFQRLPLHSPRARTTTMSSASIEPLAEEEARRRAIVQSLVEQVGHLSPALRDQRLVRRFAETRGFRREETLVLLQQYATYRVERGLDDDSLPREAGVAVEMRKRHTMRLLDPRRAPRTLCPHSSADTAERLDNDDPTCDQALTFLQMSSPSLWPTARDRDGCPVIYTNVEQYARGIDKKAVESTLVWTCELVCREMDNELDDESSAFLSEEDRERKGKFTILLDLTSCVHVHLPAFCKLGEILQRALKSGFRGRLHRFYIYPTCRKGRVLLKVIKPLLGRYTPPKIKLVDKGDLDFLADAFPREILPPHLGGTSHLLSVAFDEDFLETNASPARISPVAVCANGVQTTMGDGEAKPAVSDARDDAKRKKDVSTKAARDGSGGDGHGDLRWFLRVPALNFAIVAVMTASSVRFSPRIPPSRSRDGTPREARAPARRPGEPTSGSAKRWARVVAVVATNVLAWRTVGWDVCGIERSGAWSAAVMLVVGAWRGRRG